MKHCFHSSLLTLILFISQLSGFAQQDKDPDLLFDDIELMLPSLETIIDSAIAKNPYVKFRDLQITVNEHKLKSERAEWTRDVGFQTDVRYGTFDNFATNVVEGQNPALISTRNTQANYGVGAYIRIPFYDFLNRKNQINLAKAEIEQAQSFSEVQRNELRQLVIRQYNELIIKHKLLKIKTKYTETSGIHMQMVEKEFINGVISLTDYSNLSEIASRAESELESAKMDFRTALMILEEIAGIKFNRTNKRNQ